MASRKQRQATVDRIVDTIWDLASPVGDQPVVLECNLITQEAFGIPWNNKQAYGELKRFQESVFEALESLEVLIVPVNDRAIRTIPYKIENQEWREGQQKYRQCGEYSWRFIGWKKRDTRKENQRRDEKDDPVTSKVKMGHLRMPPDDAVAICDATDVEDENQQDEVFSFPISTSERYKMLKQCLPCPGHGTVAYAVHLPGVLSGLVAAKLGKRSGYAETLVRNINKDVKKAKTERKGGRLGVLDPTVALLESDVNYFCVKCNDTVEARPGNDDRLRCAHCATLIDNVA